MEYIKKILSRNREERIKPIYDLSLYNDTYKYPYKLMRWVGIRLSQQDSPFFRTLWNAYYWVVFVNLIISLVCNFTRIILIVTSVSTWTFAEINMLFSMLPCVGYTIMSVLKSYKMVLKRSVYDNLISELRDMWPRGPVPEEDQRILTNSIKQLNSVVLAYYLCNILLCISFTVPSLVDMVRRLAGVDLPRILPFPYWVPWNEFLPGNFELTLVWQIWQTLAVVVFMLCGDCLFFIFLSHIATQFDVLSERIRKLVVVPTDRLLMPEYPLGVYYLNIERDSDRYANNIETEKAYEREMAQIMNRHRALIRLANDVEDLFSFAMFFNFLCSTIMICFSGFCCVRLEKWNEPKYKFFLVTSLSQMWLLCRFGQKVLESSSGIANALYECGWYRASKKLRIAVLIMLCRAQREVHMTTYGFTVISLTSYSTLLKSSWSYFMLLINSIEAN